MVRLTATSSIFFSKGKWHSGSQQTIRGVARQRVTPLKLQRSKEPFVAKLWLIVISTKKKRKRAAKANKFTWEQDYFDLFFYFPSLGIFKKTWWIWHKKIIYVGMVPCDVRPRRPPCEEWFLGGTVSEAWNMKDFVTLASEALRICSVSTTIVWFFQQLHFYLSTSDNYLKVHVRFIIPS